MRNLIAASAMAALLVSQASATVYVEQEPEPETPVQQSHSSSNGDILAILGVVAFIAILSNRRAEPDLSEPRPRVRPQSCLNKHGVIVACHD